MALFWFLLALVLLAAALVLLRLDAKKRGGGRPAGGFDEVAGPAEPVEAAEAAEAETPESDAAELEAAEAAKPAESAESAGPETAETSLLDPSEPTVESSPRLLDKVRAILPARRQNNRVPEPVAQPQEDPLAGSPVVRWLEDREFEPTPTPAPEFRHGDFAVGLSALGTVSHGMFRGRRAIMGVTGGRTVLALRRDTASDVVLDLSRPDVDVEPGFHDAGRVGELEARTSDYGRLDLIDRERLVDAVGVVPVEVRRIWAESEWVAATIDGADDPSTWDDVVMALHGAADVVAPFPPIGGRARALPTEIDPGAPGAADGPEADPTVGMDGEVGTGTHGVSPTPGAVGGGAPTAAPTGPASVPSVSGAAEPGREGEGSGDGNNDDDDEPVAPEPRRSGHLRLVPDRTGVRDLTNLPVVADRGDETEADAEPAPDAQPGADLDGDQSPDSEPAPQADGSEPTLSEPTVEEPDPFAEIMEPGGPVASRGDVAADFLPPRPPLSRPTRGIGQTYPEDAAVPPLAAGAISGTAGIKPLGSEDDADEIREEVERFDAARIDGGSDFDSSPSGRHAQPAEDESTAWSRPDPAPEAPRAAPGKHRRPEDDDEDAGTSDESDARRERPGVEPDVEQTARLHLPPEIRD